MTQSAESGPVPSEPAARRPPESLEELARKQGVAPVEDLDALAARWPVDDDPDELDEFIRRQRALRRRAVRDVY